MLYRKSVEIRLQNVSSEIDLDFKIFSWTKNLSKQKCYLQIRTCTVNDRTGGTFFQGAMGKGPIPFILQFNLEIGISDVAPKGSSS